MTDYTDVARDYAVAVAEVVTAREELRRAESEERVYRDRTIAARRRFEDAKRKLWEITNGVLEEDD